MTVSKDPYYHWSSRSDSQVSPYNDCSPNLRSILGYCTRTFGGKSLGCHVDRSVSGSSTLSSHAWGAALDYLPDGGNYEGITQVAPFLIGWSQELGVNTIHDYVRQLMWKPNTGWNSVPIGSRGGQWLHIETTPSKWGDGRPVEEKISTPPPPPPDPNYNPSTHNYGFFPGFQPKAPLGPGFGYTNGTQNYQGFCAYAWDVMKVEAGQGPVLDNGGTRIVWTIHSMAALMNIQQFFGLPVNGWMTIESWAVIDGLATNFGRPR